MARLSIDSISLGKVKLGSKHEFSVNNISEFRVDRIKPECGCTSAIMGSNGKEQVLTMSISITKEFPYSVPKEIKEVNQKKSVIIYFSDGFAHTFDIHYTISRLG